MNKPHNKPESVGVLLFEGAEELDFVGPWEMLTMWRAYADGPHTIQMVAPEKSQIACAKGMNVIPHVSFDDAPDYDMIFVPGGFAAFDVAEDRVFIDFVRRQSASAILVASICTGAFILYAAGLLEGRRATTHWKAHEQLDALRGVEARRSRFEKDEKIWTSAGVSAGVDMTLAIIAHVAGDEAAGVVQLNSEYYPLMTEYPAPDALRAQAGLKT